jgi:hypothetical protein
MRIQSAINTAKTQLVFVLAVGQMISHVLVAIYQEQRATDVSVL